MYNTPEMPQTSLAVNASYEAETLETKIERMISNKEPLEGDHPAPIIFTERKDGVGAAYNIRTDRFELAIEAADKIAKSYSARREERNKLGEKKDETGAKKDGGEGKKPDGGAEPIQAKPTN